MQINQLKLSTALFSVVATLSLFNSAPANAQLGKTGQAIAKQAVGFLNTGGYFFSGNTTALGSPKFYRAGGFYVKPKHVGGVFSITGGIETVSASDHFFPFTGGNEFSLLGPSGRVTASLAGGRLKPFVTGGLFAGRVRSVNLGFDRTQFTPSASFGLEAPLGKYVSIQASYRITQKINGVDTSGFGIDVKLF